MNTIKTCMALILTTQFYLFSAICLAEGESEAATSEAPAAATQTEAMLQEVMPQEAMPQDAAAANTADDKREQDHAVLRKMLGEIQKGLNNRDFAAIKPYLHENVIITFLNAEMTKGISGAEAYMNKMFEGAGAILKGYSTEPTVDQPAIFYGNVAVAAGHTLDNFKFTDNMGLELNTRWSTTLIKEGDAWKIIALHFSGNMFSNPILTSAKNSALYFGIAGLVLGILVILVMNFLRRGKSRA